jgi:hypothetical protein
MMEIVYWAQLAIFGSLLVVSVSLFANALSKGDRSLMNVAGEFLWIWCGGGVLIMVIEALENFII